MADFEEDLAQGSFLREEPLTLEEITPQFRNLVAHHTARHGFRTYDVLHVAAAQVMQCQGFWSFDAKARHLARLEGLKVHPQS